MGKTRIYIVEDEALTAKLISHHLAHLGYEVCGQATRGEKALEEIPSLGPDIVVMDIQLAGELTGIETTIQLRKRFDIPIVYLSAAADDRQVEEAIGSGSFGYLVKPFEKRELHATIQAALYKHQVEQLLREDVRRHAALLERTGQIARIGGWELAIPSLELTWSAELYRIHEMERTRRPTWAEAISFCAPESRPILERAVRQAIENGTPYDLELAFSTAQGRRFWVRTQGEVEREDGKIVRLIGSLQDITERQEASEALRRSETRFRTLYDATSDAVMVLDERRFLDCNPATLAIFGCASREEFCSNHPADVSPPLQPCGTDSLTLAKQRIATALKMGNHAFEWLHRRADTGRSFPAEVSLTAMQLDGRLVLQAVVRDITERKRIEAAERERGEQLLRFQSALLTLRNHEGDDLPGFLRLATEEIARVLAVERVGIWFFDDAHEAIVCHDLFRQSRATHEAGLQLRVADFPDYFKAFSQRATVLADEACAHPDSREYAEAYLKPNGITSMLDAPLRLGRHVTGLLCCEHTGPVRHWTTAEERFVVSAAATVLLVWDNERRRKAEAALKESEARLRSLAEAATEGIFFHDKGIIFDANPEGCRLFGYRLEELVGLSGFALLAPELREALRLNMTSVKDLRYQTTGLRKDGSRFPLELSARNTVYQGQAVRVVCVRDLTELHEAERQLRENEARLQRVMEGSQQGYWDWNVVTGELILSDRWFEMLGYQPSELEQKYETWETLLHPEDKPVAIAAIRANLEDRADHYEMELRMRNTSGDWQWILTRGQVVRRDAEGRTLYVSGTQTDITERKAMEARLRDRETLLSSINTHLLGSAVFRLLLSPDGRLTSSYVTPNVGPFLGVEPAEFLAHPDLIFARVVSEDLPLVQAANQRAFETGEDASFTFRIAHPDGGVRWLHYRGRQIEHRPDGTRVRDGIATDITAIKEAEAEVRRQAEFLNALHQTTLDLLDRREMPDLMQAIVERAAVLLAAPFCEMVLKENDAMVVVAFTRNQAHVLGSRFGRAEAPLSWEAHDTARPVVVTNYSARADRRGIYDSQPLQAVAEFPILHGNVCLGVLSLGRTESGRSFSAEEIQRGEILAKKAALVMHNASIFVDALREAELRTAELRESEELYRSLVETSPAAIVVADLDGRVLKVNDRATEIFDEENDPPALGRSILEWVAPAEIGRLQTELARLPQAGNLHDVPAVLLRQRNRPFDALIDAVIIKDAAGRPKSRMLLIQDVTERRRAERALLESEEQYRGLVTSMNDGVFVVDARGWLTFANPALARIMGFEHPNQVVGRSLFESITPGRLDEIAGYFRQAVETGRPRETTIVELVRPDGTGAVVEVKSSLVKDGDQVVGMKGMIRDITQQKQAEQALTSAHRRTMVLAQLGRELAEVSTSRMAALSILQAARQLIDWDCSWLHLWDERKHEFENVATFDLVEGERREVPQNPTAPREISPMLRRVMEHGAQLLLRKSESDQINDLNLVFGSRRSLSLMFVPIRLGDRFIGILSIQSYQRQAYDRAALTLLQTLADHCGGALARIQATSALAVSEDRFRRVWENATDGMRLTDAEGRVVAANEAFCQMFGRLRNAVEGRLLSDLYAEPGNLAILERHRERFARRDILTRLERQLTLADGRAIWLGVSNCFIETDPARPLLLGIFRDITERKLTEDALRFLSAGVANLAGDSFFNAVAVQLARLLGVEIAFIGKLLPSQSSVQSPGPKVQSPGTTAMSPDPELRTRDPGLGTQDSGLGPVSLRIRTLGLCIDGTLRPGVEYDAAGTPCARLMDKQTAIVPDQVAELFPSPRGIPGLTAGLLEQLVPRNGDQMLQDLCVASYAAVPLADLAGRAIGHVGVMSRQSLHNPNRVEAILQLFAVRVAAEIERQRAERRFHDLFEFSPDAILMTDHDGRIMMANRQAEKLFGYAPAQLVGQPVKNLLPASRLSHVAERQAFHSGSQHRVMAGGRPDLWGLKKDGTEFPVDVSLNPLESDTGTWVAAAVRDLTELRRAQQQTLRAQRLESIGTLAGGVAHDLNNALAPIVVATELLHETYPNSTELIDTMSLSARRAANMVKQLLTFARGVEGARLLIQPLHLLKEMEKFIKSTFPKNIVLRTHYAPRLHTVLGDTTQLHQVLLNLCVNARDAMPEGGTLTLTAENAEIEVANANAFPEARPGQYAVWRVTDTGTGIPPEIAERIFEPFFSTKGLTKGTGLGLSTATGIVNSHGGFIRVSSPRGQGATFEVYLPASDTITVPFGSRRPSN